METPSDASPADDCRCQAEKAKPAPQPKAARPVPDHKTEPPPYYHREIF